MENNFHYSKIRIWHVFSPSSTIFKAFRRGHFECTQAQSYTNQDCHMGDRGLYEMHTNRAAQHWGDVGASPQSRVVPSIPSCWFRSRRWSWPVGQVWYPLKISHEGASLLNHLEVTAIVQSRLAKERKRYWRAIDIFRCRATLWIYIFTVLQGSEGLLWSKNCLHFKFFPI